MSDYEFALKTTNLAKRFGTHQAVRDLNLEVRKGDIYGLLGLNGAGKTTAIRMALGLLRPSGGSIEMLGNRVAFGAASPRKNVGAFVEGPACFAQLSVQENLLALSRLSAPLTKAAADALLEEVGIFDARHRRASALSMGMRQRLGIALALAGDPQFIILDEPTNGLDPRGIHEIRSLLLRLHDERDLTLAVSSHLLHEVEQLCTRVGIINNGSLAFEGELSELLSHKSEHLMLEAKDIKPVQLKLGALHPTIQCEAAGAQSLKLTMTSPEQDWTALAPRLAKDLVNSGIPFHAMYPLRPSLEELFLELTETNS